MAAWRRTEAREISAREEPPVQQAVTNDDWDMFGGAEFIWLLVTWGLTVGSRARAWRCLVYTHTGL